MAYKITDTCVACGTCIGECPVEAISAGDIYVIDPDKCIDCGTCAGVCPIEAIVSEERRRRKIRQQPLRSGCFYGPPRKTPP